MRFVVWWCSGVIGHWILPSIIHSGCLQNRWYLRSLDHFQKPKGTRLFVMCSFIWYQSYRRRCLSDHPYLLGCALTAPRRAWSNTWALSDDINGFVCSPVLCLRAAQWVKCFQPHCERWASTSKGRGASWRPSMASLWSERWLSVLLWICLKWKGPDENVSHQSLRMKKQVLQLVLSVSIDVDNCQVYGWRSRTWLHRKALNSNHQ